MPGNFFDRILDLIEIYIGKKHFGVLLLLLLLGWGMFFLISRKITGAEVLAATFSLLLGLLYVWALYQDRFRTFLKWSSLALLLALSIVWIYEIKTYRSLDQKKLDREMKEAQQSVDPSYAARKFNDALSLANRLNDDSARQQCACALGQLQEFLGNQTTDARTNLSLCLSLSKGNFPAEALADVALGQFEGAQAHDDEARKYYLDAIEVSHKLPHPADVGATANRALGDLAKNMGRVREAYSYYKRSGDLYLSESDSTRSKKGEADNLIGTGDLKLIQGFNNEARQDYSKALESYQALMEPEGEAEAHVGLGDVERDSGHNAKAREEYGLAIGLYGQEPEGLANAQFGLGELERELGNSDKAREYFKDAYESYESVHDNIGQANVLVARGALETMLGQYDQARETLSAATKFSEEYPLGEANCLESKADLESERGNYDLGRRLYIDALDSYQKLAAPLGKANVKYGQGKLETKLRNYGLARQDYETASQLYKNEDVKIGVASVLLAEGDLERKLRLYDQARHDYMDALGKYTEEEGSAGIAKVRLAIGDLEHDLGHNGKAEPNYGTARGLFQQQGNQIGEADVDLSDARALLAPPPQKGEALKRLDAAYKLYCRIGMRDKLLEVRQEKLKLGGKVSDKGGECTLPFVAP